MVPAVPCFYFPMCYCEYGKEILGNCLRNKQPHEWKIEWTLWEERVSPPVQRMSPVRIMLKDGSCSKKKPFKTVYWGSAPTLAQKEVCYLLNYEQHSVLHPV